MCLEAAWFLPWQSNNTNTANTWNVSSTVKLISPWNHSKILRIQWNVRDLRPLSVFLPGLRNISRFITASTKWRISRTCRSSMSTVGDNSTIARPAAEIFGEGSVDPAMFLEGNSNTNWRFNTSPFLTSSPTGAFNCSPMGDVGGFLSGEARSLKSFFTGVKTSKQTRPLMKNVRTAHVGL